MLVWGIWASDGPVLSVNPWGRGFLLAGKATFLVVVGESLGIYDHVRRKRTYMSEPIGFIGLGNLGLPMAVNLLDSGYVVTVYNRTASKAESLVKRGARIASSPADAVPVSGIVVTVLWDAAAVESVVTSDGFLDRLGPGGIHVCMCTGSAETAKRLAALHAEHGSTYVEAPVFGRPEAAVAKKLWILLAGPGMAKDRVRPLITAMGAQGIFDFGEEVGAATVVKLVGNFLIISAGRSLAEALVVAERAGVDPKAAVAMLTQTLFPAPIYQSYGKMIAEKTVPTNQQPEIPLKDLGLFQTIAQQSELATPIAHALLDLLQRR
jgi:3-hydroxyisobutyrate dehydrogenase-like beta-hydroxyacid dehydrogenase